MPPPPQLKRRSEEYEESLTQISMPPPPQEIRPLFLVLFICIDLGRNHHHSHQTFININLQWIITEIDYKIRFREISSGFTIENKDFGAHDGSDSTISTIDYRNRLQMKGVQL
ncbi:hypothetical protein L1887_09595 [Cichorium endivia]|nr:hypothetical protein L1887_09595 [Cichorium endivia]